MQSTFSSTISLSLLSVTSTEIARPILVFWLGAVVGIMFFLIVSKIWDFTNVILLLLFFSDVNNLIASGRGIFPLFFLSELLFFVLFLLLILLQELRHIDPGGLYFLCLVLFGVWVFYGYFLGLHHCGGDPKSVITSEATNFRVLDNNVWP